MKQIFLLSNTPKVNHPSHEKVNHSIKLAIKDMIKIAYISSETDDKRRYFDKAKLFYTSIKDFQIDYFDYDKEYRQGQTQELRDYDMIHFSTGNTFNFLSVIKDKNELENLKTVLDQIDTVIATSAGAHLMCPSIKYAKFGDENHVLLDDLKAFSLVDFYIIPHVERKHEVKDMINEYAKMDGDTIYFLSDGQGITIELNKDNYQIKML